MKKLELIQLDRQPNDTNTELAIAIAGMWHGDYALFGEEQISRPDIENWRVVLPVIVSDTDEIQVGDDFLPDDIRSYEKAVHIDKEQNMINGYHLPSCQKVIKYPHEFDVEALNFIINNFYIKKINHFLKLVQ